MENVKCKSADDERVSQSFIRQIIEDDLKTGKHSYIITRFPPEPNGFLHLGHAKSICLNFGLARDYKGQCHLRFDDTNPEKEEDRYIRSIVTDVRWLGFDWGDNLFHASDYFLQLYEMAETLIKKGKAYVDDQREAEVKNNRGDLVTPGVNSPFRDRSVEENLELFHAMRAGKFADGEKILRAKIDMAHPNPLMRDPPIYRIKRAEHPRTGNEWCIYPLYDFAHGQSDSVERITHSICTLEFEVHRPLYDWYQEELGIFRTRQIEFARLNVTYMVMSKRKLQLLVEEKHVKDWDDPRMPTISGMRRRGIPALAIRNFCAAVGVAKRNNVQNIELFENMIRESLHSVPRRMGVIRPLRLVITNWDGPDVEVAVPNHPELANMGTRTILFGKELLVDSSDFSDKPGKDWFRLAIGKEVRLKYAFWVTCQGAIRDAGGNVTTLHCTYDPATRGGNPPPDGRKVKGTLTWIHARTAVPCEYRLYDRLFTVPDPECGEMGKTWRDVLNPNSLELVSGYCEATMADLREGEMVQVERFGFFTADKDTTTDTPVFNRTIALQDTWAEKMDVASPDRRKKESEKQAREKAAAERAAKKADKQAREAKKQQERQARLNQFNSSPSTQQSSSGVPSPARVE